MSDSYNDDVWEAEESDFAGYIDDGEVFDARILSVKKVKKNFIDRETNEPVWKSSFKFEIISDGPQDGRAIWGETGVKLLINNPDCKLTNWVESALGMNIPKGYRLVPEVLADRRVRIQVGKREYEKDGQTKQHNFVKDVIPTREAMQAMATQKTYEEDEPF